MHSADLVGSIEVLGTGRSPVSIFWLVTVCVASSRLTSMIVCFVLSVHSIIGHQSRNRIMHGGWFSLFCLCLGVGPRMGWSGHVYHQNWDGCRCGGPPGYLPPNWLRLMDGWGMEGVLI